MGQTLTMTVPKVRSECYDACMDISNLHDFPDRATRSILRDWRNLRDTVMDTAPEIAARLAFERAEPVDRSFLLEDWRGRESDILYRIPFRSGEGEVLICLLLEHQSTHDPRMPLRLLIYMVLYWEREWKQWEDHHEPGEPLHITPILPIVFHTGQQAWRSQRKLSDLIHGPEELLSYIPDWQTLFWDLAEWTPEQLLQKEGAWMQALAVVRAERSDLKTFSAVFSEALRRVQQVGSEEGTRRHDLLWFLLSWAVWRRPPEERDALEQVAVASQGDVSGRQEVKEVSETTFRTWEQWHYEEVAKESARAAAAAATAAATARVEALRDMVRRCAVDRLGGVSLALEQSIAACSDTEKLQRAAMDLMLNVPAERLSL
jgi:hypothetical protein